MSTTILAVAWYDGASGTRRSHLAHISRAQKPPEIILLLSMLKATSSHLDGSVCLWEMLTAAAPSDFLFCVNSLCLPFSGGCERYRGNVLKHQSRMMVPPIHKARLHALRTPPPKTPHRSAVQQQLCESTYVYYCWHDRGYCCVQFALLPSPMMGGRYRWS